MVRDFSCSYYCNTCIGTKRISIALKKIGSYVGKIKNTLSNIKREVSSVTNEIDIDDISDKKKIKKDNKNKDEWY